MRLDHKIADFLGYDLIKTRKNILLPRHLHNLFALLDINCVLDVGANYGQYGTMLRDAGYQGRIISFEPVSSSYQRLQQTAGKDGNWDTCNFALGRTEEELEINVTAASDFASFLPPSEFSKNTFGDVVAITRKERVQIKKLDDIFDKLMQGQNQARIHLKMDTQGYDLDVFKGAKHSLQNIASLQSEISVLPVYEGMPDYLKSLTTYRSAGFEVTGMFPVSHDSATLMVVEFDCVLRKAELPGEETRQA
ncbi:MAG: hypothetical protein A2505_06575 [Deltaproteobacteria bacterium RIFOXYD12_FULL_55_16]|nr:MAG: hypothetical protein A2505_06575 [Deltaproteobacteria bacterium RIFOXYD12_FULL_55_16]